MLFVAQSSEKSGLFGSPDWVDRKTKQGKSGREREWSNDGEEEEMRK